MKLAGPPRARCRYTLNLTRIDVTVGGIFPPEHATFYRALCQQVAELAYPRVRAEYDRAIRQWEQEMVHGKPGAIERPVGILSPPAPSPLSRIWRHDLLTKRPDL